MRNHLALTAVLALAIPAAFAQTTDGTAKQDMKAAGHDTTHAVKETGNGIAHGTKTVAHKTADGTKTVAHDTVKGTKKGYHKTAHVTKKVGHKIEGKPDTIENNPPR